MGEEGKRKGGGTHANHYHMYKWDPQKSDETVGDTERTREIALLPNTRWSVPCPPIKKAALPKTLDLETFKKNASS